MRIEFTKMHGLGNDFMVIDLVTQRMHLTPDLIRRLADRQFGVGFDQMLVVEPPNQVRGQVHALGDQINHHKVIA